MSDPSTDTAAQLAGKMGLWILMLTIILLFGSLGLAFLFSTRPEASLQVPPLFYGSTLILALSSLLLHRGWQRQDQPDRPTWLGPGIATGLAFLVMQAMAWYQLYTAGWGWVQSRKAAFLYLLTGLHAAHLVAGLLFLLYVWRTYERRGRRLHEPALYFWHFLGVLWLYLLALILINS